MFPRSRSLLLALPLLGPLVSCSRIEEELKLEIPLPADCRELRIEIPTGGVTVEAGAEGRVQVDAITGRAAANHEALERLAAIEFVPRVVATDEAGVYLFTMPGVPEDLDPNENVMIFRGLLRVPADVAIALRTARGDVAARGFRAAVDLETSAGDLQLHDVRGPAHAATRYGNAIVTKHHGDLAVATGEGTILAYVDELGPGGVDLRSTGTAITCDLPAGVGFELDARVEQSETGKVAIRNAFEVPVQPDGRGHRARGTVLGGGPPVRLAVGRGWISLVAHEPGN